MCMKRRLVHGAAQKDVSGICHRIMRKQHAARVEHDVNMSYGMFQNRNCLRRAICGVVWLYDGVVC
jgi:hypothetical protein